MNRYDIRNNKTNLITHSYTANTPKPHNPAWGLLERLKWRDECTVQEIADSIQTIDVIIVPAIPSVPAVTRVRYLVTAPDVWKWIEDCTPQEIAQAVGSESIIITPAIPSVPAVIRKQCRLPQTYTVVETDLTGTITAENLRRQQIATLKARLKSLVAKTDADITVAETKELIVKLVRLKILLREIE